MNLRQAGRFFFFQKKEIQCTVPSFMISFETLHSSGGAEAENGAANPFRTPFFKEKTIQKEKKKLLLRSFFIIFFKD